MVVRKKKYAWNAQLDPVNRMDFAGNTRTSTCPNQLELFDAIPPRRANVKWKTNLRTPRRRIRKSRRGTNYALSGYYRRIFSFQRI